MGLVQTRLPSDWTPASGSLAGRVILVTGATGGLGSAVARACAATGATLVLVGRRVKALEALYDELTAAAAPQPAICPLDLERATPAEFTALAGTIERELGRLDGVIHAAAHFDGLTPLDQHAPDQWLRTLQVNLSAPFALQQALSPLLKAAPDGAAVFVLDDPERMRRAHWGAYGVAKAGLEAMVAMLHDEAGESALRVHALLPAPMRTKLRRLAWFGEDTMQHPLPETTAAAAVYLLSADGVAARGSVLDLR
jgi:NAD(P)-dependent dehydrogenase (short-subunit alcohol dehydrogenase family)